MSTKQSATKITPSTTGTAERLVTDLAKDFEPFVNEFLNIEGGVTRFEVKRTAGDQTRRSALTGFKRMKPYRGLDFHCRDNDSGVHEVKPSKTALYTLVDKNGKEFDYEFLVEGRELREGETVVPPYSQAFFTLEQRPNGIFGQATTFARNVSDISPSLGSIVDVVQTEPEPASLGGTELNKEDASEYDLLQERDLNDPEHTIDVPADRTDNEWGLVRRPESGAKPWGM
jgi:hypothetical protein